MLKSAFKLLAANALVLLGLLALGEIGLRAVYFVHTCRVGVCDGRAFQPVNFITGLETGLYRPAPVVGYEPKPGEYHIDGEGWDNKFVTVKENATRDNGNALSFTSSRKLLAVGDSFTFGVQVSDDETWPSALERKLGAEVVNAGVGGYGFGQAALRARLFSEKRGFDLILLSVLVPEDLDRDQLLTRTSAAKPVWIKDGGKVRISYPEEIETLRSKMMSEDFHLPEWVGYSYLLMQVNKRVFGYYYGQQLKHPDAAEIDDIVCYVTEDYSALPGRKAILMQYRLDWIEGAKPSAAGRIQECAERYEVPVFDSYGFLREHQKTEDLFFGHMRPNGNERLAEFLESKIHETFPEFFSSQ